MRIRPHLEQIQERQRQRELTPEVFQLANLGDPRARAIVYRNSESAEDQARLLEEWGMLATRPDILGEPTFA